jgi:hypothetical protein
VAKGEIVAGEAALFRPEDQGHAAAAVQVPYDARGQIRQRYDLLLRPAIGEGRGAGDQGALGQRLCQAFRAFCVLEQFFGADGGLGLAPVGLVGRDGGEKLATARAAAPMLRGLRGETRTTSMRPRWGSVSKR